MNRLFPLSVTIFFPRERYMRRNTIPKFLLEIKSRSPFFSPELFINEMLFFPLYDVAYKQKTPSFCKSTASGSPQPSPCDSH